MIDTNYSATASARMAGIPAENANVLSEYASEELDLVGIGYMVAATPNDEVNTLACLNLGHSLGNSNVFQLQPIDHGDSERKSASTEFNGRVFGSREMTSKNLKAFVESGAVIKRTSINEEFSAADFQKLYGESALILFRLSAGNTLSVVTPDTGAASAGDQLISLVFEQSDKVVAPMADADGPDGPAQLP